MKRLLGALAFIGVTAGASAAMGQEIQLRGPLAGAPACRRCVLYRAGRLSVAPTFGITLVDPFDRVLIAGANLQYHITDGIGIGLWGGFGVAHIDTSLTNSIVDRLGQPGAAVTPNVPNGANFRQQIGRLNWIIAPQLTAIPLRGKLALFQNIFIDTDFYIFAGVAIAGVTERAGISTSSFPNPRVQGSEPELIANQIARASRVAIGPSFGVGINFYFNRFLSLSVEYRAFPFSWNISGTDEDSAATTCGANGTTACNGFPDYQVSPDGAFVIDGRDNSFRFNQMVNFGFNIFLPTGPRISP